MKAVGVLGAALGCAALLGGCAKSVGAPEVRASFSALFNCGEENVKVTRVGGDFDATGCDHHARFICTYRDCRIAPEPPRSKPEDEPNVTELHLSVGLEDGVVMWLVATPAESEDAALLVEGYFRKDCTPELMIDGETQQLEPWQKGYKLSRQTMRALAGARQLGLRLCTRHWSLLADDISLIRRFSARYFEELGWEQTGSRSAEEHAPPRGGWQPWQPSKDFPQAAADTLAAEALFQKVSPSIARVECELPDGTSQGSAVAVAPDLLLTNCHVVSGARKIKVMQGKSEWPARLQASDPDKDRCTLQVAGAHFKPILGVRPYVDMKVGERLYTVGNPNGFDLTLTDGILSALREEGGVRYVQTTAPISPGSSGGGLFDTRGNLVGITTLVVVGEGHLNQSLNFAIAAEMFWAP
ncbi:MAG TPA: S1C family serine protease [Polyangiaceae bacterium]|nr:S1C family serine protease [Polyangiaceae bacterium]